MEFLKSCTTNVQVAENLHDISWSRYRLAEDGDFAELLRALAAIRELNTLCTLLDRELWIFGDLTEQHFEVLETLVLDRSVEGDVTVLRHMLEAIETSISVTLAQEKGMLHIGSWTWLFSPEDDDTGDTLPTLVRVHPHLTDNGTLYLAITTHACPLKPVWKPTPSETVILAPSGRVATVVASTQEHNGEGGERKKGVVGGETWKQRVIDTLATEDIYVGMREEWTTVELLDQDERHHVLWPVRLCLTKTAINNRNDADWRYWFSTATSQERQEAYRNPLAEAEDWFKGASEEAMIVDEVRDGDGVPMENIVTESPMATSPPFNQRAIDHQAAMLGIYPTPPDGFLPAQPHPYSNPQHSYTSDGAGVEFSAQTDPTQLLGSDGSHQDQLHQSLASSTEAQSYQPNNLPVDDLFGDIDAIDDEFGANDEVGDADFDYFDVPDEIASPDLVRVGNEPEPDVVMSEEIELEEAPMAHGGDSLRLQSESPPDASLSANPKTDRITLENPAGVADNDRETISPPRGEDITFKKPEKPLSPFGIRERLLPKPIPASASLANDQQSSNRPFRRSSTFDPLSFNEGLNLGAKYESKYGTSDHPKTGPYKPNIMLPLKKKKKLRVQRTSDSSEAESDRENLMESPISVEDSYDDSTSLSEVDETTLPPRLPWDTKKRKRDSFPLDSPVLTAEFVERGVASEEAVSKLSGVLASSRRRRTVTMSSMSESTKACILDTLGRHSEPPELPIPEDLYQLAKLDLVYIAQIVSEQAVTATANLVKLAKDLDQSSQITSSGNSVSSTLYTLVADSIQRVLPDTGECSLSRLVLTKEPPSRMPNLSAKSSQASGPRPPIRDGSMQFAPDYFAIPNPFIHVQRATDNWEMLPVALNFWSSLGLGPANGSKDVRVVSVVPDSQDVKASVKQWMVELGRVYEGYKLGSFDGTGMQEIGNDINEFDGGVVEVRIDNHLALDVGAVLKTYVNLCIRLGKSLAKVGYLDADRTLVICFVNPFEDLGSLAMQHLSASFWHLYKAYRDNIPKAHRNSPRSDVVMQILPISLVASPDGMVMLNSTSLGSIATEIYDRCPPSSKATPKAPSDLVSAAAPAVELAKMLPRRLVFQLTTEPGDLLHENSILHLAYSMSKDGMWMTSVWMDNTGHFQRTVSSCARGKSFKAVAAEIWDRTMEIIEARDVTWRVFIATSKIDDTVDKCWREIVPRKLRKPLHVTLLAVENDSSLTLKPPNPPQAITAVTTPGGGFLTPASTPQAPNLTSSPDASGQSNAPLTPAASDAVTTTIENDPDAHLLDPADESWGMLLANPFLSTGLHSDSESLHAASGLIFRRGDAAADIALETLRVDLHWDIRIRPNGQLDESPPRQVEANLREILKMYRNLSLLGRARGIISDELTEMRGLNKDGRQGLMPLHLLAASKAANSLNGFLARE